jgi:hypothetical protein
VVKRLERQGVNVLGAAQRRAPGRGFGALEVELIAEAETEGETGFEAESGPISGRWHRRGNSIVVQAV